MKTQKVLLRVAALVLFTGLPGVILPAEALEKFSWLMGYGQPRLDPLSIFMTADAAFASLFLGIIFWFISCDLPRHQPLVRCIGWLYVLASPVFLSVGFQCPLPLWWTLSATLGTLALGIGLVRAQGC